MTCEESRNHSSLKSRSVLPYGSLILNAGVWNTTVVLFNATPLLDLMRKLFRDRFLLFNLFWQTIGTTGEHDIVEQAYRNMQPVSFSRAALETVSPYRPSFFMLSYGSPLERLVFQRTAS